MLILVKSAWTWRDYLKSSEAKGRKVGKPHGSHIDGLAELKKAVVLCDTCEKKFKRNDYCRQQKYPFVRGDCDACKVFSERAALFMHESLFEDSGFKSRIRRR